MRVRNVSRITIVHCAEPPPRPVIRSSFGFDGAASNGKAALAIGRMGAGLAGPVIWMGSSTIVEGGSWSCAIAPAPSPLNMGEAFAAVAASRIRRQSIGGAIKDFFTIVPSPALELDRQSVSREPS